MTMQSTLNPRQLRSRVGAAFRKLAQGARRKSAYASTLAFYRATGHAWTRAFGY
jgi:hypothetical protein